MPGEAASTETTRTRRVTVEILTELADESIVGSGHSAVKAGRSNACTSVNSLMEVLYGVGNHQVVVLNVATIIASFNTTYHWLLIEDYTFNRHADIDDDKIDNVNNGNNNKNNCRRGNANQNNESVDGNNSDDDDEDSLGKIQFFSSQQSSNHSSEFYEQQCIYCKQYRCYCAFHCQ
ncbi:unnamed protein product [Ceratitis capitata]|uniref:(Mediterranean fruit fly) hypothetical protein n=1 Tax=Ceratitis capitata TaxID=7213 RepID=A0A811V333_CERCA|nr:unnamed protein product [Ceratitis capitata]